MTRQPALTAKKEAPNTKSENKQPNPAMTTHEAHQTVCQAWQNTEAAYEAFANMAARNVRINETDTLLMHAIRTAQACDKVRRSAHSNPTFHSDS